jgi:hypothetical protein
MQIDYCVFDGLKMVYRIIDNGGDRNYYYNYDTLTELGKYESSLSRTGNEYLTLDMFGNNDNDPLISFDIKQQPGFTLEDLRQCLLENRKLEIPLNFLITSERTEEIIKADLKNVKKIKGKYHINSSKTIEFVFGDNEGETIYYQEIRPSFSARQNGVLVNGAPKEKLEVDDDERTDIVRIYGLHSTDKITLYYLDETTGRPTTSATIYYNSSDNKIHLSGFVVD